MSAGGPRVYLRYDDDPVRAAAAHVIERCAGSLPDLSHVTIVVADGALIPALRAALDEAAGAAGQAGLLGPVIAPLDAWAAERAGPGAAAPPSREARELMLFEALAAVPHVVDADNRWQLAESLLGLFEELGQCDAAPAHDADAFIERLREAYGIPAHLEAPLSREARLVHTLWHAWRDQLEAEGRADPGDARTARLARALEQLDADACVLLLAPERLGAAEAAALAPLIADGRVEVLLRGNDAGAAGAVVAELARRLGLPPPPPPGGADAWIDSALGAPADAPPLAARAIASGGAQPVAGRWRYAVAHDAEQEARAVTLAAVEAAHAGAARVVVATENRRLARRVRALLERFGLALADEGGWALSTTSAAAVVERWLECIEQDFDHRPLLDVLKSPFLRPAEGQDRDALDASVFHFEQDLVRHENVARDLDAYRRALGARSQRLGRWSRALRRDVRTLIDRLERAARPLRRLADGRCHPPLRYLDALAAALGTLGIDRALAADAAGERVLAVLGRLRRAAHGRDLRLDWTDFRSWCGRALEQEHFVPPAADGPVVLADLARGSSLPCERLILAGADAEHLPGGPGGSAFFNDAVRAELGLATWPEHWGVRLHRFRRALGNAPEVVITRAAEREGEAVAPAPWVEALAVAHELAFGSRLGDGGLIAATAAFDSSCREPLPAATRRPAPAAPPDLLPERLSASRHQDLVACPYRFFAGSCLRLEPLEEIREELRKSDYGERLHRALHAFWQPLEGMPAPWQGTLDGDRRAAAIAHLETLIDAAFADDAGTHFTHRAWRLRARALAPALVDWAIRHGAGHRFEAGEQQAERALTGGPVLRGRLDRVDRRSDGHRAVVDYKSGRIARRDAVLAGEDVQLATYALVADDVTEAAYLGLAAGRCTRTVIEGDETWALAAAVERRLLRTWEALAGGAAMPAWSNAACAWCEMEGLCRRPQWPADV